MLKNVLAGLGGRIALSIVVACATVIGTALATNYPDVYRAICGG